METVKSPFSRLGDVEPLNNQINNQNVENESTDKSTCVKVENGGISLIKNSPRRRKQVINMRKFSEVDSQDDDNDSKTCQQPLVTTPKVNQNRNRSRNSEPTTTTTKDNVDKVDETKPRVIKRRRRRKKLSNTQLDEPLPVEIKVEDWEPGFIYVYGLSGQEKIPLEPPSIHISKQSDPLAIPDHFVSRTLDDMEKKTRKTRKRSVRIQAKCNQISKIECPWNFK